MRVYWLAIALLLTLTGCASLETVPEGRDEGADTPEARADLPDHAELYRLDRVAPPSPPPSTAPDYGLWTRLAQDFTLYGTAHDRIDLALFDYLGRLDQIETMTQRAEPYLFFIVEELRRRDMPMELALLPIVESAYQPQATSRSQAAGLWQFLPSTGLHFGLKQNAWYDGRRDVYASTHAALDYLQRLHDMFGGDWLLALAAYNAGEGTLSEAIERAGREGKPSDYWSLDLPQETRDYVPRLLALARLFRNPDVYGLELHKVEDAPFLARIELDRPLDLSKVAQAMDMSMDELYRLNPGFKRGISGNGKEAVALLLPQDKAERLRGMDLQTLSPSPGQGKAARPETASGPALRHTVAQGESLYKIARRYGVDIQALAAWNGLKEKTTLKVGQRLVVYTDAPGARGAPRTSVAAKARRNYTVRKGDTLFAIAKRFKVAVAQLRHWNGLGHEDELMPGQTLVIAFSEGAGEGS